MFLPLGFLCLFCTVFGIFISIFASLLLTLCPSTYSNFRVEISSPICPTWEAQTYMPHQEAQIPLSLLVKNTYLIKTFMLPSPPPPTRLLGGCFCTPWNYDLFNHRDVLQLSHKQRQLQLLLCEQPISQEFPHNNLSRSITLQKRWICARSESFQCWQRLGR